ncbi:hypothetical protein ACR9VJ_26395 [Streptomyces sp. H49]|uniref:hypothetical protein n=1 Tax=Streptomyces sp. H49 TaxID=3444117 RepID=UPI003F4AD951
MAKTWNPGDSSKFARQLTLGKPYYVVTNLSPRAGAFEDRQMYSKVTFTKRLPFTGTPCTEGGYSAETLCRQFGPVYDQPPAGIRNAADLAPQVAGPLDKFRKAHEKGRVDEAEATALEELLRVRNDPAFRDLFN